MPFPAAPRWSRLYLGEACRPGRSVPGRPSRPAPRPRPAWPRPLPAAASAGLVPPALCSPRSGWGGSDRRGYAGPLHESRRPGSRVECRGRWPTPLPPLALPDCRKARLESGGREARTSTRVCGPTGQEKVIAGRGAVKVWGMFYT